jgi:hypothetical protein
MMDWAKPNPGTDVTPESPLSSSTPNQENMATQSLVLLLHHQVQLISPILIFKEFFLLVLFCMVGEPVTLTSDSFS